MPSGNSSIIEHVMSQRETAVAPPVGFSPDILRKLSELETAVGAAIHGKPEVVRLSLVCLLARGHLQIGRAHV